MNKFFSKTFSTFFWLGFLPAAPGTWGALGAFVLWVLFLRHMDIRFYVLTIILLSAIGIYTADFAEKHIFKKHDSPHIVIDEACGFFVSMIGVSTGIYWGIAGFILFRIFDIWKPYPINKFQSLPGGFGIMVDDIGAGIYVAIILNAAGYFLL
ncbi:MAG: phosphatidylglycerophosphatase A [Proteobacteria bacterium]|nr:phosphatidylglycerophosphatase A [Pseudomonadota bacterium]